MACVGNIFKSDDGFGVEVAAAWRGARCRTGCASCDYGIRSVHLVYELLDGYDVLVLVDTVGQQEGPPGTLYVIEPDLPPTGGEPMLPEVLLDPHDLAPGDAMALVPDLGGSRRRDPGRRLPARTLDDGIGLSDAVAAAVEPRRRPGRRRRRPRAGQTRGTRTRRGGGG